MPKHIPKGRKHFSITLGDGKYGERTTTEYPFGTVVTLRWSNFITMHTAYSSTQHCDFCGNLIWKLDPYLRGTTMHHEIREGIGTYRRCMTCIGKGIFPHPDIQALVIVKG